MANFQAKNPNLGKVWSDLQGKMLVYFIVIWYIFVVLWYFCGSLVYFCGSLVYFFPFWYVVPKKIWQP
jgi:hypothetical protein